ncbi:MAG: rhomboid family intramembrane serine protease [Cytophagales bacterium]|nr:MAG: rhomboid family intramembrane serine protease [Cytophagales bacterium]
MNNLTPVVRTLLVINVILFACQIFLEINFPYLLGLRYFTAESFAPYQILTYMFIHSNLLHLFSNMLGLFMFGSLLESTLGPKKFLWLYLIAGLGAGVLHFGINALEIYQQEQAMQSYFATPNPDSFELYMKNYEPQQWQKISPEWFNSFIDHPKDPTIITTSKEAIGELFQYRLNIPMVGASGAVFGLLAAFAMIFPNLEIFLLFIPFPIKAKYFIPLYVCYELYAGLYYPNSSNIAHFAHVSGALVGFLLIKYWKIPRRY